MSDKSGDRVILHCDCNSFFASVEMAHDEGLRSVPMAVGGSEENRHGIILAKNELAKQYGIVTAETIYSARKKCKNLVIVPPHYSEYARYSRAVHEIYLRFTDQVEPFGMDEAWLDVTGSEKLFGDGESIAHQIRETVKRELSITISVGVSFTKVFAKLGSDYKKPDAVTVISRENYKSLLSPLPVSDMIFIGKRTSEELLRFGIRTLGELSACSQGFLISRFGKNGGLIYEHVHGIERGEVAHYFAAGEAPKSVGNGMTFRRDLVTEEEIAVGLLPLCEEVAARMRVQDLAARTLSVTVKGSDLLSVSKQAPLDPPTSLSRELFTLANRLVRLLRKDGRRVRALTVTASNLIPSDEVVTQVSFFDDSSEKRKKLERIETAVDRIRDRFGNAAVLPCAVLETDIGVSLAGEAEKADTEENDRVN